MGRADLLEGDPPCFVHCFMAQTHAYPVYVYIYNIHVYIHTCIFLSLSLCIWIYLFIYLSICETIHLFYLCATSPGSLRVVRCQSGVFRVCGAHVYLPRATPGRGVHLGDFGSELWDSLNTVAVVFFFGGGAMESPSVLDGHAHMNFKYVFFFSPHFFPHI